MRRSKPLLHAWVRPSFRPKGMQSQGMVPVLAEVSTVH